MELINYDSFKVLPEAKQFLEENPSFGTLKVSAFTAYKAMPIPNTEILITKDIGNYKVIFFEGYTDSSGVIDNIKLPAPEEEKVATYEVPPKYTVYDLTAINEGYERIKKYNIGVLGGVKIIQYVKMIPKVTLEGGKEFGN